MQTLYTNWYILNFKKSGLNPVRTEITKPLYL